MIITLTPHSKAARELEEIAIDPAEFLTRFPYQAGPKDGPAFCPAIFRQCKCDGTKHQHRLAANVTAMTAFVADIDHLSTLAEVTTYRDKLDASGRNHVIYSTWQSKPTAPRMRIIFPLTKPISITSPVEWSRGWFPRLMQWADLPVPADMTCRDPSRLYYLPRIAALDGAPFTYVRS